MHNVVKRVPGRVDVQLLPISRSLGSTRASVKLYWSCHPTLPPVAPPFRCRTQPRSSSLKRKSTPPGAGAVSPPASGSGGVKSPPKPASAIHCHPPSVTRLRVCVSGGTPYDMSNTREREPKLVV